jgi:hypothetical protein
VVSNHLAVLATLVMVGSTAGDLGAADDVILRTSVDPQQAWIGQRALLTIEVLGADGWAQVPRLPEPGIPGAYVLRTDSQGVRLNETIRGTSYTGQRYRLSVYCQRPGRLEIPALPVTVVVKQWGFNAPETSLDRSTPPVELDCRVPPGAEDIRGLISTTRLDADQQWSSRSDTVALGDAITRTVRLSAADVSAMAFPPMQHPELEGVGIYPGEPTVADTGDRGTLRGERVESVTYVFEQPGDVVLPTIVLSWWDVDDRILRRVELPGLELVVEGELPPEPVAAPAEEPRHRVRLAVAIMVLVALGLWLGRGLAGRLGRWFEARRESEPVHFRRVLSAMRGGDPGTISATIMSWLDRLDPEARPARLDLFLDAHGDEESRKAASALARCLATGERFSDGGQLVRGLKKARRRHLRTRRRARKAAGLLPELNPKTGSR